jgi:hypothetical protein
MHRSSGPSRVSPPAPAGGPRPPPAHREPAAAFVEND